MKNEFDEMLIRNVKLINEDIHYTNIRLYICPHGNVHVDFAGHKYEKKENSTDIVSVEATHPPSDHFPKYKTVEWNDMTAKVEIAHNGNTHLYIATSNTTMNCSYLIDHHGNHGNIVLHPLFFTLQFSPSGGKLLYLAEPLPNYERVLEEGLPDYKMPAFYDRKVQIVRHIGLLEGIFTLFVLATFIQYGMHWAAYFERKMNKQAEKKPRAKKNKKAGSKDGEVEKEEENESLGPKPTVYDTLPFQVFELCKQAPDLPAYLQELYADYRQRKEEERKEQEEEEEARKVYEQKKLERKQRKAAGIKSTSSGTESS